MNIGSDWGALNERIITLLVKAGWLQPLADCDGNVGCLRWTRLGRNRQTLVRHVIVEFGLDGEDEAPARFTRECREEAPHAWTKAGESARSFWLACLEETGVEADERWLWSYVRLIRVGSGMPYDEEPEQRLASSGMGAYVSGYGKFELSGWGEGSGRS